MKTGGKILVGAGVIGAGALLFLALRRKQAGLPLVPSLPSEWELPSFTTTSEFLAPAPPPPGISPCGYCPSGTTPVRSADGSCRCAEVSVEVLRDGTPCRSSAACGPGYVCVNGSCEPTSSWES